MHELLFADIVKFKISALEKNFEKLYKCINLGF